MTDPVMLAALAAHDIGEAYRCSRPAGISQRQIPRRPPSTCGPWRGGTGAGRAVRCRRELLPGARQVAAMRA
ncbi:MAG: hypothetical protein ACRDRZ_10355 [Pseudonocardiaceae bacterium]